jgi:transposase
VLTLMQTFDPPQGTAQSRKAQRYHHHSWAFYQLRQFVAYKAHDAGVPLVLVKSCGYLAKLPLLWGSWSSVGP